MDLGRLTRGNMVAALGAILVLIGLFFLPWFKVEEAKLAPLQISSSLYAQATTPTTTPTTTPGTSTTAPTTPGQATVPPTAPPQLAANIPPASFGAWRGQGFLGTIANLVILAAAVTGLGFALLSAAGEGPAVGSPGRVTTSLGVAALAMLILRIFFPVEEIAGFEFSSGLKYGIFITLIGVLMLVGGGLLQQQEEVPRTRRRPRPPGPRMPPPDEPPERPPSEPAPFDEPQPFDEPAPPDEPQPPSPFDEPPTPPPTEPRF